jgi:hypothetical protein
MHSVAPMKVWTKGSRQPRVGISPQPIAHVGWNPFTAGGMSGLTPSTCLTRRQAIRGTVGYWFVLAEERYRRRSIIQRTMGVCWVYWRRSPCASTALFTGPRPQLVATTSPISCHAFEHFLRVSRSSPPRTTPLSRSTHKRQ